MFTNNTATRKGGAISYSLFRPIMTNNTFSGNTAPYGEIIGSYAIKIAIKNSTTDDIKIDNAGSGIVYEYPLTFALYDHDSQIVSVDNSSQITISSNSLSTQVLSTSVVKVDEGEAYFDDIAFVSEPGMQNVSYKISSPAVDLPTLRLVYGSNYTQNNVVVNFRFCKPGEYITSSNECRT